MKILIGICGIGNGHLNRQTNVIEFLLSEGNSIVIATTKNNIEYFKERFNRVSVLEINIPWIACNNKGIDFEESIRKYDENNFDQFKSFLDFSIKVKNCFNSIPNLVITDYEPNVAQYSYATSIPLICMEQQSKFLYLEELMIERYSILEEQKRLNYFFPKFEYKIISSFFPIKINEEKVKVVTPIISKLEKIDNKKNHILVYFSPYENSINYEKVLDSLNNVKNIPIIVYSKEKFKGKYSNDFVFKKYSDEFKCDLVNASCLISTAGHQLLSESISIDIPVYIIPLSTYEQNYNAKMIEKYDLGVIAKLYNFNEISEFINKVPFYSNNIKNFRKKYYKNNWQNELLSVIEKYKY